ncbi:hypothetical protein K461DRAFT_293711 [Myriangium duriaei CBS 260.36]|uniref:Uncharacterized protein n=1 Tax=Myriangium duriaei CBS 260.36 TaxID=1168546 RepID=A0A9P4MN76_9PEZI|nr:hypothetical protein K461DRAFT_293711 [Myriangium duriaei CBS 260.36]
MYVEGLEQGVRDWVDTVHNLRYKDYQLTVKPAPIQRESNEQIPETESGVLRELDTVKAFSLAMKDRHIFSWWRRGMGFEKDLL